jgi:hypothetical protein
MDAGRWFLSDLRRPRYSQKQIAPADRSSAARVLISAQQLALACARIVAVKLSSCFSLDRSICFSLDTEGYREGYFGPI